MLDANPPLQPGTGKLRARLSTTFERTSIDGHQRLGAQTEQLVQHHELPDTASRRAVVLVEQARLLLLPAASDVAGNPAGNGANRRAGPSAPTGDCGNAGAGRGADGCAAHRPLLLGSHRGAADHARSGEGCGKQ
ncbi:hypothetical protein D9M71_516600 [compost metagenome]